MPHCIVEYSKNLESFMSPRELVNAANRGAVESGLFDSFNIKSRAIGYQHYLVAGEVSDFIHVQVKILPGRTEQQKSHLSGLVLDSIKSLAIKDVTITVEVCDLHGESYAKFVDG